MEFKELVVSKVKEKFGSAVVEVTDFRGDPSIEVKPESILEVAKYIKEDSELDFAQ